MDRRNARHRIITTQRLNLNARSRHAFLQLVIALISFALISINLLFIHHSPTLLVHYSNIEFECSSTRRCPQPSQRQLTIFTPTIHLIMQTLKAHISTTWLASRSTDNCRMPPTITCSSTIQHLVSSARSHHKA